MSARREDGALERPTADARRRAPPHDDEPPAFALPEHPDRAAAIGEAHARPSLPISSPSTVHHLAFSCADQEAAEGLFRAVLGESDAVSDRHTIRQRSGLTIKWERHTEFASLTLLSPDEDRSGAALLAELTPKVPVGAPLYVALKVQIRPQGEIAPSTQDFGGTLRGGIEVYSTFRTGEDGFIRIKVATPDIGADQLGRRIQRLLEIETYRTMTLVGLPTARRVSPILSRLEGKLAEVTDALTKGDDSDAKILDSLQRLSAETEAMRAQTRFRFSASRAYAALVDERLTSLNETRLGERPSITGFTRTRLRPAVRTIESAETRQAELSAAVGRTLELLRARVDVSLNRANQEILTSMNERQHRQLVLSEAVESLSVIAISYYLLGILSYPVRALVNYGFLPGSTTLWLGLCAPAVAALVFVASRRLRARWAKST